MKRPCAFVGSLAHRQQPPIRIPPLTHRDPFPTFYPPTQLYSVAAPVAAVAAPAARGLSLIQFLLAFTLGGLFFTTALTTVTAVLAVGRSNILRLISIFQLVIGRVWQVFVLGLKETRAALRFDGTWNFKEAWKVLKAKLLETRQTVTEGVEAIKQEAKLYSAAVGAPGLIPIQYVINHLMPYCIAAQMKKALKENLLKMSQTHDNPHIRSAQLVEWDAGKQAPQLLGARVYDLGDDAMAFDLDINWQSDLQLKVNIFLKRLGVKIPVTVKNCKFEGPVRVELSPLTDEMPGFGAILVSLPSIPKISSDISVIGGDIAKVPWLQADIKKGTEQAMRENFLWPKRIVLPSEMATAKRTILTSKQLEELATSDPFSKAEESRNQKAPVLRDYVNLMAGELASIPDQLQIDVSEPDLVFDAFDANQDGNITKSEFMAAANTIDQKHETKLSKKELRAMANNGTKTEAKLYSKEWWKQWKKEKTEERDSKPKGETWKDWWARKAGKQKDKIKQRSSIFNKKKENDLIEEEELQPETVTFDE